MTADQLAAIAGALLSLAFSYIPGLADKFSQLDPTYKRLIMGGLLVVVAGAVFGLSCGNVLSTVTCDKPGALGLLGVLINALVANQSVYQITKRQRARA